MSDWLWQRRTEIPGRTALGPTHVGDVLPITKIPTGVTFKPGDESVYAGKGDFYTLRYGPYLIGMNMTPDKTFPLLFQEKSNQPKIWFRAKR